MDKQIAKRIEIHVNRLVYIEILVWYSKLGQLMGVQHVITSDTQNPSDWKLIQFGTYYLSIFHESHSTLGKCGIYCMGDSLYLTIEVWLVPGAHGH